MPQRADRQPSEARELLYGAPGSAGSFTARGATRGSRIERLAEVMSPEEFSELKGLVDDPGEPRKPADLVAWLKENAPPGVKLTVKREPYRDTFGCIRVLFINGSNGLLVTVQVCSMFGGVEWQTYRAFPPSDEPHMIVE